MQGVVVVVVVHCEALRLRLGCLLNLFVFRLVLGLLGNLLFLKHLWWEDVKQAPYVTILELLGNLLEQLWQEGAKPSDVKKSRLSYGPCAKNQ